MVQILEIGEGRIERTTETKVSYEEILDFILAREKQMEKKEDKDLPVREIVHYVGEVYPEFARTWNEYCDYNMEQFARAILDIAKETDEDYIDVVDYIVVLASGNECEQILAAHTIICAIERLR